MEPHTESSTLVGSVVAGTTCILVQIATIVVTGVAVPLAVGSSVGHGLSRSFARRRNYITSRWLLSQNFNLLLLFQSEEWVNTKMMRSPRFNPLLLFQSEERVNTKIMRSPRFNLESGLTIVYLRSGRTPLLGVRLGLR